MCDTDINEYFYAYWLIDKVTARGQTCIYAWELEKGPDKFLIGRHRFIGLQRSFSIIPERNYRYYVISRSLAGGTNRVIQPLHLTRVRPQSA